MHRATEIRAGEGERGGQDAQGHRDPGLVLGRGRRRGEGEAGRASHLIALPDGVEVLAGVAEPQRQPRVDAIDGHLRLGGGLFVRSPALGRWVV